MHSKGSTGEEGLPLGELQCSALLRMPRVRANERARTT